MQVNNLYGRLSGGGKLPTIQSLNISENGTYTVPEGVDGFNPVNVNVPISPSIGKIIVDKFQYVVNGNKLDIPCTLNNQTCYAFIIYDNYMFSSYGFACGCFYKKESGSVVEQNYINYPNTLHRYYWSNSYFGFNNKFNSNTQSAYITIIEIDKNISDSLISN